MSNAGSVIADAPGPIPREMRQDELRDIPKCLPRSCLLNWLYGFDLLLSHRARKPVGWIVELEGRIAGFAVCALVSNEPRPHTTVLRPIATFLPSFLRRSEEKPLRVELLEVVVAIPGPGGDAVEQILLRQVLGSLGGLWSGVPVVVPERYLAAQVLLRGAGFRAIGVMHEFYGGEDGYVLAPFETRRAKVEIGS